MKLENLTNLYFVVAVLVPGFIHRAVLAKFLPLRASEGTEGNILGWLTASAFNYAVCSPLIYLLVIGGMLAGSPVWQALVWFVIVFLVPIALGLIRAEIAQNDHLGCLFRWLRLRPINPIPTGWDWQFSRMEPRFVLVTLEDGTELAGYFGEKSMASSDPDRRDIYLEQAFSVPEGGGPWTLVDGTEGVYIDGAKIVSIEFRK